MADGKVGRAGIALTAVGPTNHRATAAEEALAGSELTDEAIAEAAALAAEAARPYSDTRGSADYKRTVVRVFTERGLRTVAERLGASAGRPASGSGAAAGRAGPTASSAEGGPPRQWSAEGEPVTTEEGLEETERHDYFSGEETVGGVMDELRDKPGGPDGGER
jgi:CO dehydrogenase flavoprotein C-terminal domain